MSTTSLIARQCRLREWAQMFRTAKAALKKCLLMNGAKPIPLQKRIITTA